MQEDIRRDYYVYVHKTPDDGRPFYVGKGTGARFSKGERNGEWCKRVEQAGGHFRAEKIADGLSEDEAYKLERRLIAAFREVFGKEHLANVTDGGDIDFGEGPMFGIAISLGDLAEVEFECLQLEKQQRESLLKEVETHARQASLLVEQLFLDDDDYELSDLEDDLESVCMGLKSEVDHVRRRRKTLKDFLWHGLYNEFENLELAIEELDEANEKPDVVAMARSLRQFLLEKTRWLSKGTLPEE